MFWKITRASLVLFFVLVLVATAVAGPQGNRDRNFKVITRNMDTGSDFGYILQLQTADPTALMAAVTQTYAEILQSNMPARADGIAAEIQALQPDVVGLQEITTVLQGPFDPNVHSATTVVEDQLQLLKEALQHRGLQYKVVAVQKNSDVEVPAFTLDFTGVMDVRLIDHDAILVRSDLPVSQLKIENVTMDHFSNELVYPIMGNGVTFWRGWIALDVKFRGKPYRFVTTHLETFYLPIQYGQALELVNGPLLADRPVILAGDLNSDANDPNLETSPAYHVLVDAMFRDIWHELHPNEAGNTWPLHGEDGLPNTPPFQRIDLIMMRGEGIEANGISLFGTALIDGVWPSDHAGVEAELKLLP
jgi:endonuclease/exonuclease/phosphatase family metal-dependent hydrolase